MSDANLTPSPIASHKLFDKYSKDSDQFYLQFYLCIPLGIMILSAYIPIRIMWTKTFEVRRRRRKRNYKSDPDTGKPLMDGDDYPDISKRSLFMWILEVWDLDTNDVYFYGGYDSAVLIIMLRGFLQICLASLPYALLVLLPFYATQNHKGKYAYKNYEDWLDIIAEKTVDGSSTLRCYALIIGAYLFSLITIYFLNNMLIKIAMISDQHFVGTNEMPSDMSIDKLSSINFKAKQFHHSKKTDHHEIEATYTENDELLPSATDSTVPSVDKYSVMIRDLPDHLLDDHKFKRLIHSMCGDHVCDVVVVPDLLDVLPIEKKVQKHKSKLTKLAETHGLRFDDLFDGEKTPKVVGRPKCWGLCGPKLNLIRYYKKRYNAAVRSLNTIQDSRLYSTPTAFVTFNTLEATTTSVQSTKSLELVDCEVMMAPRPQDIFWENLHFHSKELILRRICVAILMVLLLTFWSIPVLAIASLANLTEVLAAFGVEITDYIHDPWIVAMLSGSVSVLILYLWTKLLPRILLRICKFLKPASRQELALAFIWRYYLCLLCMVLLVTVITSAILNHANKWEGYFENFADNIGNMAELLAEGLSNMSIYFLLYFTLKTFVMIPLQLFRPSFWWKKMLKSKKLHQFSFYRKIPRHLLMFTILLTYSVMNPILWIFGFLYFLFTMMVYKYQFVMAYIPVFEIGPQMWVLVFDLLRWSFVISIATLYGLLLLRQNYFCSALLLPLLPLVLYQMGKIKQRYSKVFKSAALTTAQRMDSKIGNNPKRANKKDAYYPPVLSEGYKTLKKRRKSRSSSRDRKRSISPKNGNMNNEHHSMHSNAEVEEDSAYRQSNEMRE